MTVCVSMCCLRCVVGCVSAGVDALGVKEKNEICIITKKNPARDFSTITVFN